MVQIIMKDLKDIINEKLIINKNTKINKYHYHPQNKKELKELISKLIEERGNEADLNDIDVSKITDMAYLFWKSKFNGDISKWDVSNVTNMQWMFNDSKFTAENGDISNWNVSKVENMKDAFGYCINNMVNIPTWYKRK